MVVPRAEGWRATVSLLSLVAAVAMAGCGGSDEDPETTSTSAGQAATAVAEAEDTTTTTADTTGEPATESQSSTGDEPGVYFTLAEPALYDSGGGVTLAFTEVRVIDPEADLPPDQWEEAEALLEEGTLSIFVLEDVTVTNDSGSTVEFFPDQGTILVGSTQKMASFWLSPVFSEGVGILDGATITHDVVFEMPIEAEEVVTAREARYVFDGPFDADSFETIGPKGDLALSW